MPTETGAGRLQNSAAEAAKPQLAKHYREIGPAALVAALICVRKEQKLPVMGNLSSARLGKAA